MQIPVYSVSCTTSYCFICNVLQVLGGARCILAAAMCASRLCSQLARLARTPLLTAAPPASPAFHDPCAHGTMPYRYTL